MISLNINNKCMIEITQEKVDGLINVDVINADGTVDYYYTITAGDMVMLLNYYQYKKDRGKDLF